MGLLPPRVACQTCLRVLLFPIESVALVVDE